MAAVITIAESEKQTFLVSLRSIFSCFIRVGFPSYLRRTFSVSGSNITRILDFLGLYFKIRMCQIKTIYLLFSLIAIL